MCLTLSVSAQKAPKKSFSTEYHPVEGVQWQVDEKISLPDARTPEGVVYTATDAGTGTFFMGRGACRSDEGRWHAIYPASAVREWESSWAHFTIPHEQVVNKTLVPMYSSTETNSLEFKPLTAYLNFEIPSDLPAIKEVRVSTNKFIAGGYKVNLDARNIAVDLDTGERYRSISLKPEDGVFSPGKYSIAIFARHLPEGMLVEVIDADGRVASKNISAQLRHTMGKARDLGILHNLKFADSDSNLMNGVGTVYGKEGVLFWVDPDNTFKGKVVAAYAGVMKWAESNELYGAHAAKENYELVHTNVTSLPAFKTNSERYPAVNACEQMRKTHGGNWHVPSATELKLLFNAYYGKTGNALPESGVEYIDADAQESAARFDAQLESLGGEKLLAKSNKYWICGQNSSGNMQFINMRRFHNGHDEQMTEKYVRCVCDVYNNILSKNGEYPKTDIGKLLKSDMCPKVVDVLWDTTYTVTNGLDYYQMTVITDAYEKQDMYLLRTDPSKGLDLKVAISDKTTSSVWKRQAPSQMAAHMDTPSNPLYAIINADFCDNREPIKPRGPVHCNGKIWAPSYSIDPHFTQQALSYVGVDFNGKMVIGPNSDYAAAKKSLKECTGAGVIMIQDSKIQGGFVETMSRDPRTAIGYTLDNIVWILVVDGRHGTAGMTYGEMASVFHSLGCEAAVNLDGGGSTQLFMRNPQTDKIQMQNWPSDPHNGFGGRERPRLNAWTIMKR